MGLVSRSLITLATLSGLTSLVSSLSIPPKHTFIPRQASPGFSGCSYPAGWESCNDENHRDCWVKDPNGKVYDISTNYEKDTPLGTERVYDLEISEKEISPDGTPKKLAKLINNQYPGQLIEACWGDTLIINVKNSLPTNGTTIHWHGIRMLGSNEMDGVNGVTQCPIAEGDTYQYKFKLTQYGHTWYHSHYSSQYSDGVAGPLLIHGPNSDNWHNEWSPILVTDWLHKSAFEEFHKEIGGGALPQADSILVNGTGRYGNGGSYFNQKFEAGKRYLIRIINASTSMHFQFSIDNHIMTVVSTDFVPIKPYNTTSLSVGIGQRYSIIVEAKPDAPSSNGKYWMRTEYSTGCNTEFTGAGNTDQISRTGIISYTNSTGDGDPTTSRHDVTVGCTDEPYEKLEPKVPWNISIPQNDVKGNTYEAGLDLTNANKWHGAVNRWSITDTPLWLNFSDPIIMNLNNQTWKPEYAVVDYNYNDGEKFVYMVITSGNLATNPGPIRKLGTAHPIHLHGHDFAVLAQSTSKYDPNTSPNSFKLDNPPRRDVAMLPAGGYLAIAFKPDNPGAWILHCHIAWHAGSGLALNILERQAEIKNSIGSLGPVQQGCTNWNSWLKAHPDRFDPLRDQEDSGI